MRTPLSFLITGVYRDWIEIPPPLNRLPNRDLPLETTWDQTAGQENITWPQTSFAGGKYFSKCLETSIQHFFVNNQHHKIKNSHICQPFV